MYKKEKIGQWITLFVASQDSSLANMVIITIFLSPFHQIDTQHIIHFEVFQSHMAQFQ